MSPNSFSSVQTKTTPWGDEEHVNRLVFIGGCKADTSKYPAGPFHHGLLAATSTHDTRERDREIDINRTEDSEG